MKTPRLFLFMLVASTMSRADIIVVYNVDFENPPHALDAAPVTGSGADRPWSFTPNVMIRDSLADFTTQVAAFEGGGMMSFRPESPSTSMIVRLSWDMAMLTLGPNGPETAGIAIDSSGGGGIWMFFMQDYTIQIGPGFGGITIGSFTLGQKDNFQFLLDLDSGLYDVYMNSTLALSNQALGVGFDVANVFFGADYLANPTYAIDNFRWEIIPEPSTLILIILGGLGVAATQKRRYRA